MVVVVLVTGQYIIPSFFHTSAIWGVYGEISAVIEGNNGHGGQGSAVVESATIVGGETEKFNGRVMTSSIKGIARVEEGHGSAIVQLL